MKIFKWIKKIGGLIVAAGVGLVIDSLLKENISNPRGFYKRMLMKVGVAAIASYAVKKVTESFDDDVDTMEKETIEIIAEIKEMDENSKESEA